MGGCHSQLIPRSASRISPPPKHPSSTRRSTSSKPKLHLQKHSLPTYPPSSHHHNPTSWPQANHSRRAPTQAPKFPTAQSTPTPCRSALPRSLDTAVWAPLPLLISEAQRVRSRINRRTTLRLFRKAMARRRIPIL